jgi:ParB family chromosome partitioning protein
MANSPRPQGFNLATLKGFRGAFSGEPSAQGEPLHVELDLIDPDPSQPRRSFPENELRALANSMLVKQGSAVVGVLSPIGVRQGEGGRWKLAFGERRLRAAKLAGLRTIPVTLVPEDQAGLAAQVIENQHRANLANTDLARVIAAWTEGGLSNDEIATIANISEGAIKHYRALTRLPEFLQPWCDKANPRALYEIGQAHKRASGEGRAMIERRVAALAGEEAISLAEARRIIDLPSAPSPERRPLSDETASPLPPRLRAAEKIAQLIAVISWLLPLIPDDRRAEAEAMVDAVLPEGRH